MEGRHELDLQFVRVLVLHSERGAAESKNISILDLVANPVRGDLNGPLSRPDRRELEHPIFSRCEGLLVGLSASWSVPEGKGEPLAGEPVNRETLAVNNFGVELDFGFGGGFAIGPGQRFSKANFPSASVFAVTCGPSSTAALAGFPSASITRPRRAAGGISSNR